MCQWHFFYDSSICVQKWVNYEKMSGREAKSAENNETDCDNPISLDEIEKGLWLGGF